MIQPFFISPKTWGTFGAWLLLDLSLLEILAISVTFSARNWILCDLQACPMVNDGHCASFHHRNCRSRSLEAPRDLGRQWKNHEKSRDFPHWTYDNRNVRSSTIIYKSGIFRSKVWLPGMAIIIGRHPGRINTAVRCCLQLCICRLRKSPFGISFIWNIQKDG